MNLMNFTIVRILVFNSFLIYNPKYCGHSSVVERLVANEKVRVRPPCPLQKLRLNQNF